jgi:hypothetical protein
VFVAGIVFSELAGSFGLFVKKKPFPDEKGRALPDDPCRLSCCCRRMKPEPDCFGNRDCFVTVPEYGML